MKLKAILFSISIICFNLAMGQKKEKSHLEISIDGGIPAGKMAKIYTYGIGGNLRFLFYGPGNKSTFDFSDVLPITVSAGIYNLISKDSSNSSSSRKKDLLVVPILIGIKYPNGKTYMATEIGWTYLNQNSNNSGLGLDVEAGLRFKRIDLGIKYLAVWGKNEFFLGVASLQLSLKL